MLRETTPYDFKTLNHCNSRAELRKSFTMFSCPSSQPHLAMIEAFQ